MDAFKHAQDAAVAYPLDLSACQSFNSQSPLRRDVNAMSLRDVMKAYRASLPELHSDSDADAPCSDGGVQVELRAEEKIRCKRQEQERIRRERKKWLQSQSDEWRRELLEDEQCLAQEVLMNSQRDRDRLGSQKLHLVQEEQQKKRRGSVRSADVAEVTAMLSQKEASASQADASTFLHEANFQSVNSRRSCGMLANGFTFPLHAAVKANSPAAVEALLHAGADPSAVDSKQRTALTLAHKLNRNASHSELIAVLYASLAKVGGQAVSDRADGPAADKCMSF